MSLLNTDRSSEVRFCPSKRRQNPHVCYTEKQAQDLVTRRNRKERGKRWIQTSRFRWGAGTVTIPCVWSKWYCSLCHSHHTGRQSPKLARLEFFRLVQRTWSDDWALGPKRRFFR